MTTLNLPTTLTLAQSIAQQAGALIRQAYHQPRTIRYKSKVDLVTQTDEAAEQLIIAALAEAFPQHDILAEESGATHKQSDYMWLIDPLDGTTNFAHGFPAFAVSIGLRGPQGMLVGVVYDPLRDESFAAARGHTPTLNGQPIHVTGESDLAHALLATGFPYDRHTAPDNNSADFARFLRKAQGIRRAGAAALDLAYVACGRLDGFWEQRLHSWDIAAGILLVEQAGGQVSNYTGQQAGVFEGRELVASNSLLHDAMLAVLADG